MTQLNQPFQVESPDGLDDAATIGVDPSLDAGLALLSDASLDTFWTELEGDLVPDASPAVLGPFATDDTGAEMWGDYAEINIDVNVTIEITDDSMAVLLPSDVDAGYADPFMLPAQDWCSCDTYDPMATVTDWTPAGYETFEDPFTLPGDDMVYEDAGAFYDSPDPGAGYWDTNDYYDTAGDYLDSPDIYGSWDDLSYATPAQGDFGDTGLGTGLDTGFDTGLDTGFDTGFDATSTWDPNAGDAAHEAFIDTITEDYSSGYADPSDWSSASDESQFWMDEYNAAEDLSWDAWNSSVDASLAGDDVAAYDLNQESLDWGATADDAWDYSADAWDTSTDYSSTDDYSSDYSSDF